MPYADPDAEQERDYRSYKIQFQAPQNMGMFTWRVYLVSDTFVGEDVTKDIIVCVIVVFHFVSQTKTFSTVENRATSNNGNP